MTSIKKDNLKALYGPSSYDPSSDVKSESDTGSPLNTMKLPFRTNDPVRRKLHPWFEDFEFYKFKHFYLIFYTGDKDEVYIAVVDLFALKDLLRNVNLESLSMIKKAKKYTRHPEERWKIVAAYCRTYGDKVTSREASMMTIFLTRIKEKELQIIAPFWQKDAEDMAERIDRREKERLQDEINELRKDRDMWRAMCIKAECENERLKSKRKILTKSKKRA